MSSTSDEASQLRVGLAVAGGGSVGALLRMWIAGWFNPLVVWPEGPAIDALHETHPGFPWGTLLVNVVGALLLGVLVRRSMSTLSAAFWRAGVLGAFTTYSAFTVESVRVAERAPLEAVAYAAVSLAAGALAVRVTVRRQP